MSDQTKPKDGEQADSVIGPNQEAKRDKGAKAHAAKESVDPFWIDKVFPDASEVFSFESQGADALTANCVFALDTNILVAPYELGAESIHDIEKIYRRLADKDRIFVPAQAAKEYGKIRGFKISDVYNAVQNRASTLPSTADLTCPILEGIPEYEDVKKRIEQLKPLANELAESLGKLKDAISNWGWQDRVSSLYRELFTAKRIIDHGRTAEDLSADLGFRLAHSTPPSYKDSAKIDGGIGDLLIWHSLIALGKNTKRDVVFVCNDGKADWSIRSNKEAILTRSELVIEFYRKTGTKFAIMNWKRFLRSMNAATKTIEEATIVESKSRSSDNVITDAIINAGQANHITVTSDSGFMNLTDGEVTVTYNDARLRDRMEFIQDQINKNRHIRNNLQREVMRLESERALIGNNDTSQTDRYIVSLQDKIRELLYGIQRHKAELLACKNEWLKREQSNNR